MDPLSVTTAVVGLLKAIPAIALAIKSFIDGIKDAPHQAQIVLQEATDIESILSQLQTFFLRRTPTIHERSAYISVEQVILTLSGSVLTFSELQEVLDGLKPSDDQGFLDRVKWVRKESQIAKIIQRLQNHKGSLGCMLHIINSRSLVDVNDSVSSLKDLMMEVLASNEDLRRRMESGENIQPLERVETNSTIEWSKWRHEGGLGTISALSDHIQPLGRLDTASTIEKSNLQRPGSRASISSLAREMFKFAFDHDLQTSRVYRKISFHKSELSLPSIEAPSVSWSALSGLSLSQISNISVLELPLTPSELSNADHYQPSEIILAIVADDFAAERYDELDCKAHEALIIIAISTPEWVVAKPIGRLGGPGLVPLSYLELRGMKTSTGFTEPLKVLEAAGVPSVQEWKARAARYKKKLLNIRKDALFESRQK